MDGLTLAPEDVSTAGTDIARAFHDDALTVHLYPDERERARLAPLMFEALVRYDCLFGLVDHLPRLRPREPAGVVRRDGPPRSRTHVLTLQPGRYSSGDRSVAFSTPRCPRRFGWYVGAACVGPRDSGDERRGRVRDALPFRRQRARDRDGLVARTSVSGRAATCGGTWRPSARGRNQRRLHV